MSEQDDDWYLDGLLFLQFLHRLSSIENARYASVGKNIRSDFAIDVLIANHSHKATCPVCQCDCFTVLRNKCILSFMESTPTFLEISST